MCVNLFVCSMCNIRSIILISALFFVCLSARAEVYVDSLDVRYRVQNPRDTMWIVNNRFNKQAPKDKIELSLKLTNYAGLNLTGGTVDCYKVDLETGADYGVGGPISIGSPDNILTFPTLNEGVYRLKFTFPNLPPNNEITCYLFNRELEFEIVDIDVVENNCITQGSDTCIFALKDHRFNPKGTKYKMYPSKSIGDDILVDEERPANVQDTFYVVFNGPTGIDALLLSVTGIYENPRNKEVIENTRARILPVRKYDKPDLSRIFAFDTASVYDLVGCTKEILSGLNYSEEMNRKYMDQLRGPNFKTKFAYEINYYRKDFENESWQHLSALDKSDYVTDSTNFYFLQSGLYRIRMKASNQCGVDSLDTQAVLGPDADPGKKRLIKIFGNDPGLLEFRQDILCIPEGRDNDTLEIKDSSPRLDWEGDAVYELIVNEFLKDKAGRDSIGVIAKEDQNDVYHFLPPVKYHSLTAAKSDSTKLFVVFYKPGYYQVILSKESSSCSKVSDTLKLKVGKIPVLAEDILKDSEGYPAIRQTFCGAFRYGIPKTLTIDSNYCNIVDYEWKFGKGSYVETFHEKHPQDTIVFDSLRGEDSYITLRVKNQCGWSESDSVSFFTYALPNVKLWRDSVEKNDTLCVGREYKYHFKGSFPADFEILGARRPNDSIVKITGSQGEFEETYKIINRDNENCYQTIKEIVWFVEPPVFHVQDTVTFCETTAEIQTWALLNGYHDLYYTRLDWKLLEPEAEITEEGLDFPADFPSGKQKDFGRFGVTAAQMKLEYYVSGGGDYGSKYKGCYDGGPIVLQRYPQPSFALDHSQVFRACENKDFDISSLIQTPVTDAADWNISIDKSLWYSKEDGVIPDYLCPADKDSVTVFVEAIQKHSYQGQKGCNLKDSVVVYITHPKIAFLKRDTLYTNDRIYDFEKMRNFTDTSDVSNLQWTLVRGKGSITGSSADIFQRTYDFRTESQGDSVFFELSGTTPCGETIRDTLKVYYPVTGLVGGTAEVCDNIKSYKLWSDVMDPARVYGHFIKTESLTWNLKSGMGYINGNQTNAEFVLQAGIVQTQIVIEAKAKDLYDNPIPSVQLIINIHTSPKMTLKASMVSPIVLAAGDTLTMDKAVDIQGADGYDWQDCGRGTVYSGTKQKYYSYYSGFKEYADTVFVTMNVPVAEQAGCGRQLIDSLPLLVYPNPRVVISKDTIGLCTGDRIKIGHGDYGYIAVNDYPDVTLDWKTKSGCVDCLDNRDDAGRTIDYISPGGKELLTLTANKVITNYEGVHRVLSGKDSVVLIGYQEPFFDVSKARDTICAQTIGVDISHIVVTTTHNDILKYRPQDGLMVVRSPYQYEFPLSAGNDTARLYIFADQKGCTKWTNKKDSIVIVRLPQLHASLLHAVDMVCSDQDLAVSVTTNAVRFKWETTQGGLLTNESTLHPVYHPQPGIVYDTVVFTAMPVLESCTDEKKVREAIKVMTFPDSQWKDDTICGDVLEYQLHCAEPDIIDHVTWTSSSGGTFKNGANTIAEPVYLISDADRAAGEVILKAVIDVKSPCQASGPIQGEIKLTILKIPTMTVSGTHTVCQGDSLDIDFLTYGNNPGKWNWNTPHGNFNNPAIENPRFYPGEISGDMELKVTLETVPVGTYTCISKPLVVDIHVFEAYQPDILMAGAVCQGAEISCTTGITADVYQWTSESGEMKWGKEVIYEFDSDGDQQVELEVTYPNGCRRSNADVVSVLPKSVAKFKPDSTVVGLGKDIQFTNQSQNIVQQWWYIDGVNVADGVDFNYTFTSSGIYKVGLEVENGLGCRDVVYENIHVLVKPIARFSVDLEDPAKPCHGSKAVFVNLSEAKKEYCSYKWILNTETLHVDTTTFIPTGDVHYYASHFRDTTYQVTLVVENAAGIDTAEYQSVTIKSRIKAYLDPENKETKCAGFDRKFMNRSIGKADWYHIKWGDGCDTTYSEIANRVVRHKYANTSYVTRVDTIRMYAGNVCETDSMKFTVKIYPNTANAKIKIDEQVGDEGCYMFEAKLHNISTGFGGIHKALWDFAEGNPVVENNEVIVSHLFQKPGEYPVVLTVFDECNSSTDTVVIKVKGNDKLAYRIKNEVYCTGQAVTFEVAPEIKDQFYDYYWNFNFGGSGNAWVQKDQLTVEHNWAVGSYQVALKAKSLDGCDVYKPYFKTIQVKETPVADFQFRYDEKQEFLNHNEVITGCNPLYVQFKNIGAKETDQVYWDFYDGGTSSERISGHTFAESGNTFVKLKVTSDGGCIDSLQKEVVVKKSPDALFENQAGRLFCKDGLVQLNVKNLGQDHANTTYLWSYQKPDEPGFVFWDDKAEPMEKSFRNTFGKMVLKLRSTHKTSGCVAEKTDTLISSPALSNQFTIDKEQLCDGEDIHFQCQANDGEQIVWKLGNGTADVSQTDFTYRYDKAGKYAVNLSIKNKYGCQQDTVRIVSVYPLPEADFSFVEDRAVIDNLPEYIDISKLPDVKNGGIRFMNHSRIESVDFTDGQIQSTWDFGDGSVVRAENPSHHFANNGQYEVKLLVKGGYGCADSVTQVIAVEAVKGLFIPNAFAPGAGEEENPGVALFQPKGIGLLSYEIRVYDGDSGICVWKSDKLEEGRPAELWNGTFNGQPLPPKLYIWEVNAVFIDGTVWTGEKGKTKGVVMLIR